MFAKRVIPCLDVDRGRVVKGTNFLNVRDAGDPVEVAARYEQEGADELVFLDITASHEEREILLDVVRHTAQVVFMPLTVGGGVRTLEDVRALLNAGADKVSINSAARRFGRQHLPLRRVQHRGNKAGDATAGNPREVARQRQAVGSEHNRLAAASTRRSFPACKPEREFSDNQP